MWTTNSMMVSRRAGEIDMKGYFATIKAYGPSFPIHRLPFADVLDRQVSLIGFCTLQEQI
jgi:hypothetical protein